MTTTKNEQKGRVFSYSRWSSDGQESGDSLRRQTERAEEWCRRHGCALADEKFIDAGVSARFGRNQKGELGRLLGLLRPGDIILAEDADRLTRQGWFEGSKLLNQITTTGARLVTLDNDKEINAQNSPNLYEVLGFLFKSDINQVSQFGKFKFWLNYRRSTHSLNQEGIGPL